MNTKHTTYHPKPVQLRLKPELHAWVHAEAERQERSANWIVNKLLEVACANSQQQTQGETQ